MMSIENGCYYCKSCDICDNKNCLVNKQKAEIERLTKRENELVEDKAHWINKWKEQVEYTAELQKQVDELKIEMYKIESSENETYMIGFEDGEKKAVKDTAKEIFKTIKSVLWEEEKDEKIRIVDVHGVVRDIVNSKYGVEVE